MAARGIKVLKHFEVPKEPGTYGRLICLTGTTKGKAYFITKNRVILGRSENADIQLLDIKSSREHAEVTKAGKEFVVTDLGSQNGVVVNDLKVKQHTLKNGDKIIIGKTVFKFSEVKVLDEKEKEKEVEFQDPTFEPEKKKSFTSILLVVVFAAGFILLSENEKPVDNRKRIKAKYAGNEINDPFAAALKQKRSELKKNKQKLNLYFQRGLREFREGNYFRAITEFEHARQWSPSDPLAKFYLRKTKEALNKTITSYFNKAARDEEAVNYSKAIVSYCSVIRLLYQYPSDERYKNAEEKIKKLEEILGMEEGEVQCLGKKGKN